MTIEIIIPKDREEWLAMRKLTIGASEAAALLGCNPWTTPYELWARKRGIAPPVRETLAMRLGSHDESFILQLAKEARPRWSIEPNVIGNGGKFFIDRDAGVSATPDATIQDHDLDREGFGVCDAKRVSAHQFRENWQNDGNAKVPVHIAIQVVDQIMLTGASWGCVAVLVAGDRDTEFHLLEVQAHAAIIARIRAEAKDFWRRVRENDPYPPDYLRDGDLIKHIYVADDGGEIDLSGNEEVLKLLARHEALKRIESAAGAAKKERDAIDRRIVHEFLRNAARGIVGGGRVLEARTVHRKGYAIEPSISRPLRIRTIKERSAAP